MTAAILQFQPFQQPIQQQQQTNDQSDYIELPLTKEYHHIMIEMLNKEHPFKAIRLAMEFNRENGFSLIPELEIEKWKRVLKNQK